ncbi:hypothetical protein AVEN_210106-1 [Araneus ventricosus]|uniref:Uncharacterized protein n=1 Tax=Araneus ventricosus TaxID=182803 RepID=A0A4Y2GBM2_ARAVE|nr:hypothetical protein AVEN_210106-1 [Araneus ventricosus]
MGFSGGSQTSGGRVQCSGCGAVVVLLLHVPSPQAWRLVEGLVPQQHERTFGRTRSLEGGHMTRRHMSWHLLSENFRTTLAAGRLGYQFSFMEICCNVDDMKKRNKVRR